MSNMNVIKLKNVNKYYNRGKENELHVLKNINLEISEGEFVTIMGPSGSGKTTLLDIMGALLKADDGKVFIDGNELSMLNDSQLAKIRREKLGFIFQQFNLIASLTALENVSLPLRIANKPKNEAINKAKELLKLVGLEKRINHRPNQLSGGEQQRVAIARALANDPKIILADEPTGNLDTKTGEKIIKLLNELNKKKNYTIVIVTHDPKISIYAERIINLKDGEIIKNYSKKG
ncbi:MAG: ABC transporter ATP-binding protein [Candidatus Heimdallarchaeaceae archaeon]